MAAPASFLQYAIRVLKTLALFSKFVVLQQNEFSQKALQSAAPLRCNLTVSLAFRATQTKLPRGDPDEDSRFR